MYQEQDTSHKEGRPKMRGNGWRSIVRGLVSVIVEIGWKPIVINLVSVTVVICIVFVFPIVKVPVEVVVTYTDTEYKDEPYTEREPYTVPATREVTERRSGTLYDDALVELWRRVMPDRWGTEVYFTIDLAGKLNPTVSGSWEVEDVSNSYYVSVTDPGFNLVYQYTGSEGAVQADDFTFAPKYSGMYVMRLSTHYIRIGKYGRLTLVLSWDEVVTELTEYRDVTKYRKVPVKVEKQGTVKLRTVTKYEKVSVWGLLFREAPKTQ